MIESHILWCALIRSYSFLCFHLLYFETSDFVAEAFLLYKCRFLVRLRYGKMRWGLVYRFPLWFVGLPIKLIVFGELLYNFFLRIGTLYNCSYNLLLVRWSMKNDWKQYAVVCTHKIIFTSLLSLIAFWD
jgi:hypothetical protein